MQKVGIIGGGPAGLMAAEVLGSAAYAVTVFDAMPTVGRKLLMAGKSGLNITHSENHADLLTRFGVAGSVLKAALNGFSGEDVRAWCAGLGVETFVGSSGRVFPKTMKASPLLRAWLERLQAHNVTIRTQSRWTGFDGDSLTFEMPTGPESHEFDAVLLALGGASWPRLGSDAAWVETLRARGVEVAPFLPANCGFEVAWTPVFIERFAGQPLKSVAATSPVGTVPGEFVVTRWGVEGSLVYAHAAALRDQLIAQGKASLTVDLMPGRSSERLAADLARQPAKLSFANRLRKGAGLDPVKAALLRQCVPAANALAPSDLAAAIKAVPIRLDRTRPIAEAISSAGGVAFSGLDEHFMLKALPGLFVAGEMLDWEAPTGGYLLTACLATGRAAAAGMVAFLKAQR